MIECNKCHLPFEQKPWQKRGWDRTCHQCRLKKNAAWRAKRKAAGLSVRGGQIRDLEKRRRWTKQYHQKPEVRVKRLEWWKAHKDDPEHKRKIRVRQITKNAIRRGELVRKPCEICGHLKVDAHHHDYNKPFEVIWLCREHHGMAHRAV